MWWAASIGNGVLMDHPIPESVFELPEREAVPGEALPELPDDAYGDDSVALEEYDEEEYRDE